MKGLIEGRIVHFVLDNKQHRPAMVVRNWSDPNLSGSDGMVNLVVFLDGANDGITAIKRSTPDTALLAWKTSIHYSEEKEPGSWHWGEQA